MAAEEALVLVLKRGLLVRLRLPFNVPNHGVAVLRCRGPSGRLRLGAADPARWAGLRNFGPSGLTPPEAAGHVRMPHDAVGGDLAIRSGGT